MERIGAGRLRSVGMVAEVGVGVTREVMDMVESRNSEDSGYESRSWLPVTEAGALRWFGQFVMGRTVDFGPMRT